MPRHYLGDYKLVLTKNHASSVRQTTMVQCQAAAKVQSTSMDTALRRSRDTDPECSSGVVHVQGVNEPHIKYQHRSSVVSASAGPLGVV